MKLRPQQRRQVDREGDESAEGQEVEGTEQPRRRLPLQQRDHRADAGGTHRLRRIAGHERVQRCPEQQPARDAPKDSGPAEHPRGHRPAEHRERLAERAEPVEAERGALPGGRRPT